jgi:hypothetical protein
MLWSSGHALLSFVEGCAMLLLISCGLRRRQIVWQLASGNAALHMYNIHDAAADATACLLRAHNG